MNSDASGSADISVTVNLPISQLQSSRAATDVTYYVMHRIFNNNWYCFSASLIWHYL